MYLADDYRPYVRRFDLHHLEASASTTIGVRSDDTIGYLSAAWYTFARDNGVLDPGTVWDVARPLSDAIPEPLRPFYAHLFQMARRAGAEVTHDYECPSPQLFRRFHMRVLPLEHDALLLIHHLAVVHPVQNGSPAIEQYYRVEHATITQCCNCRLVRRAQEPETWDWAPAWVEHEAPNTTQGLCPRCLAMHYPRLAERYATWRDDRVQRALGAGPREAGLNGGQS